MSAFIDRLLAAPYAHTIGRDNAGNSHVTLMREDRVSITIVAPTFDEAVTRALDAMDGTP